MNSPWKSCEVLDQSEVNKKRIKKGDLPANLVLLRDAGDHLPALPTIKTNLRKILGVLWKCRQKRVLP